MEERDQKPQEDCGTPPLRGEQSIRDGYPSGPPAQGVRFNSKLSSHATTEGETESAGCSTKGFSGQRVTEEGKDTNRLWGGRAIEQQQNIDPRSQARTSYSQPSGYGGGRLLGGAASTPSQLATVSADDVRRKDEEGDERDSADHTQPPQPAVPRFKWLPSRRARANTLQRMEIQKLQNEFEEKDFAEMEREEIAEGPKNNNNHNNRTATEEPKRLVGRPPGSDWPVADGTGTGVQFIHEGDQNEKQGHHQHDTQHKATKPKKHKKKTSHKKHPPDEDAPKRKGKMDIAKLEERLAKQKDNPAPTMSVDPITGEKRRLLKCTLCMAYNSLKVCAKGMCSRCCPVGGNPCDAHAQRQRKMEALREAGIVAPASQAGGAPSPLGSAPTGGSYPSPVFGPIPNQAARKNKKRKSNDADVLKKAAPSPSFDDPERSKKRRTETPTPSMEGSEFPRVLTSAPPQPHHIIINSNNSNNTSKNSVPTAATAIIVADGMQTEGIEIEESSVPPPPPSSEGSAGPPPLEASDLDESGKANQKKCTLCHSNNYLKICPKEMCRVCCPKDGIPCNSHLFQETLKKNAELSKTRREQDRRPVKLDKNGRRIPLKCSKCTAYNAMKDCARDLCSVCCRKDPGGMCDAHAFIFNKTQKANKSPGGGGGGEDGNNAATSPRNYSDRRKLKKNKHSTEGTDASPSASQQRGDGMNLDGDEDYVDASEAGGRSQPAKRRWTEMPRYNRSEEEEGEGDLPQMKTMMNSEREENGGHIMSPGFQQQQQQRGASTVRCCDCNVNAALRMCAKGMCSLCCPKAGTPCFAHQGRLGEHSYTDPVTGVKYETSQEGGDRGVPLKKRLFLDDAKPASPGGGLFGYSLDMGTVQATGNGAPMRSVFIQEEGFSKPSRYHALKCVSCNSYNMLKSCSNSMCSVCCSKMKEGPCLSHMKRTGDAGEAPGRATPVRTRRMPLLPTASPISPDMHSSRRAKQNTIAKMKLQQLQDEFDSDGDDNMGNSDASSSEGSSDEEGGFTRPPTKPMSMPPPSSVFSTLFVEPKPKTTYTPTTATTPTTTAKRKGRGRGKAKQEETFKVSRGEEFLFDPMDGPLHFTEYDMGSDYEQEFVDDLQFITCSQVVAANPKPFFFHEEAEEEDNNTADSHCPSASHTTSTTTAPSPSASSWSTTHTTMPPPAPTTPVSSTGKPAAAPIFIPIPVPNFTSHSPPYKKKTGEERCVNCKTTRAHSWRDGWIPEGSNTPVTLCNGCGIRYNKDMFCSYCNYIYMADEDWETTKWIGCDMCNKWIHRKCEEKRLGFSIDQSDLYLCPSCRIKHARSPSGEVLSEKMKRDELRRRKRKQRKTQNKQRNYNPTDSNSATLAAT